MARPDLSRVPEWSHNYINLVKEDDLIQALQSQALSFTEFLQSIPIEKSNYRYAENKWTLKELLLHILDTERIFAFRGLCIARKEKSPLPGFEENEYAVNSKAEKRDWNDLINEFKVIRKSTEILFGSFDQEQLDSSGIASGKPTYVLAIGFIIAGHINHHINIIRDRYLNT